MLNIKSPIKIFHYFYNGALKLPSRFVPKPTEVAYVVGNIVLEYV